MSKKHRKRRKPVRSPEKRSSQNRDWKGRNLETREPATPRIKKQPVAKFLAGPAGARRFASPLARLGPCPCRGPPRCRDRPWRQRPRAAVTTTTTAVTTTTATAAAAGRRRPAASGRRRTWMSWASAAPPRWRSSSVSCRPSTASGRSPSSSLPAPSSSTMTPPSSPSSTLVTK